MQAHNVYVDKTQKGDLYEMTKYWYDFKSLNETLMIRYENSTSNVLDNTFFTIAKPCDQNRVYERIVICLTTNLP